MDIFVWSDSASDSSQGQSGESERAQLQPGRLVIIIIIIIIIRFIIATIDPD